jgi:2-polyprenyl-3-methyl-5-hydroxy-6-metoxy-1,4-benzoquinol methylase
MAARAAQRAAVRELAGLKLRRAYRGRFVTAVHPEDHLLHYSVERASGHYRGFDAYFTGGLSNVRTIEDVLTYGGVPLADAGSVLEFACGYGRLTRHLVPRIGRSRLTVADVDRAAVDFVTATFGVTGFYSTSDPADLERPERYDLILVISLFSHLPAATWDAWLGRLISLLEPGGALLFSTLPLDTLGQAPAPEDREGVERGFLYKPRNETRGRLSVEEYGTTSVSLDYVRSALPEAGGELGRYCPRAFNGMQDAYLVRSPGRP